MFLFRRPQQTNHHKMDRLFYNSVKRAKGSYNKKIVCHIAKAILLIAILIVGKYALSLDNPKLQGLAYFGIIVSIINALLNFIFVKVYYRDSQSNNKTFLSLSVLAGHSATQQPITNLEDLRHLEKCVSPNLYNQVNGSEINDPALTQQIKQKYEKINRNLVQTQILQRHKCFPVIDMIGRILCLAVVVYGIVALATSNASLPITILFIIYLVLQSINIWLVIFILLLIIFSPLICCFGCIYLCIYGSRAFVNRDALSIPNSTKATAQVIENAEGTCTVCLQNLQINQDIIALPCSSKHVFHQNCIMSWLKVSNSCPICRAPLPNRI